MTTSSPDPCTTSTMTFLFTDIEGSTRQWEESPGMPVRVAQHFTALHAAVEQAGGEVFATMGDGIAAAFTSAEAAVNAAVAGQRAMPSIGLAVRMGIHTGEVERVGADFRGRPVNRAARIMAIGHGGQILASDVSASLVRGGPTGVGFTDLGMHRLRDLNEPERIWQAVHPDLADEFPPVRGVDSFSTNLPAQRSSLIGRDADAERVVGSLRAHRIVTLTGVGGVGKTRLAIQVAADLLSRFANVWFVELAGVADPDDVADAIALSLGLGAVGDPLVAAAAVLAGRRNLLVVDNCEHLVDRAAEVIDALTAECLELHVLATSREALGIDGEQVVRVRSLDPATTAIELFRQRAEAAGADLAGVTDDAIEQICRRLDGIPLAIELAAARASSLGVPAVAAALDDRFDLLGGGRRRAVDRHGTMRATIDWSYRLLDEDERRMFRWLSLFPSGFELDAATGIARALGINPVAAADHLASLVHKSMVITESAPSGVRFRVLETMRAFALARLDQHDERPAASLALAEWMTTITDVPYTAMCGVAAERNSIRLEREADTWREAMIVAARLGSGDLAARLCGPPTGYFLLGRHDLVDFVRPVIECSRAVPAHRRATLTALMAAGAGATDPDLLQEWADEMSTIDRDEATGIGVMMQWLACVWRGDFVASTDVTLAGSFDLRLARETREMYVGIAAIDHFSLTDGCIERPGLIGRALDVAEHSDVAITRVTCWLGAAWGLAATQPERALRLVRRALAEMPNVAALTRVTLPGNASRLMARLDPGIAARGLIEQIEGLPARRAFVDLIPIFYAAELLKRVGHPAAVAALAAVEVSPVAPLLSMMDFVDLARRATSHDGFPVQAIERSVCAALAEIATGNAPRELTAVTAG